MRRKLLLIALYCIVLSTASSTAEALAPDHDTSENAKKNVLDLGRHWVTNEARPAKTLKQYYDEFYNEKNGYLPVPQAVQKFEALYGKQVELPTRYPFAVLMQKGKLEPSPDRKSTSLRVYYPGMRSGDMFIIDIINDYPLGKHSAISEQVQLKDGTKAVFKKYHTIYSLEFVKKNGLHYKLGVWKHKDRQITKENLKTVAESMIE